MTVEEVTHPVFMFWRIFGLNALVLGAATALLLWAPVTVSVPVVLTEAVVLLSGLAVMLIANAALLRIGLAPLDRLSRLMTTVDLLHPGRRLPEPSANTTVLRGPAVVREEHLEEDRIRHAGAAAPA